MKLAKLLKRLSSICFLLMWIPFAVVMIKGPLKLAMGGIEDTSTVPEVLTSFWIFALGGLFAGTVIFFIASLIIGAILNHRILVTGQASDAQIIGMTDTGTRINDNPVIDFDLHIQPANYPAFVAQARKTISMIHLPSYQTGKIVSVKFIPGADQVAIVGPKR